MLSLMSLMFLFPLPLTAVLRYAEVCLCDFTDEVFGLAEQVVCVQCTDERDAAHADFTVPHQALRARDATVHVLQ